MGSQTYFFEISVALRKFFARILRTNIFILFIGISTLGLSKGSIEGKLDNAPKGSNVSLYYLLGTSADLVGTSELKSGKLIFNEEHKRGFYRLGKAQDQSRVVVVGNEALSISGEWDKWSEISIQPSKEDDLFNEFQTIIMTGNQGVHALGKKAQKLMPLQRTDPEEYQARMANLKVKFDSVMLEQEQGLYKLSAENSETYIGKMAGFLLKNEETRPYDYFSVGDLTDEEYLSGEMVKTKLSIYFQRYLGGNVKNWQMRFDQLLTGTPEGNAKLVMYSAGMDIFVPLDQKYASALAKRFYKDFPNSPLAKHYYDQLPKAPPSVGDVAPNIALANPEGNTMELTDLKGKVVLLDFWASWCGPCRRENPNVVKAYNEYKDKGFTVFSVSLDNNKDRWLGAIQKDGLVWENHVSDLKGWKSAGAKKYGVRGIPATFLIDEKGVIRAVNVRGGRLEKELNKLLETQKEDG